MDGKDHTQSRNEVDLVNESQNSIVEDRVECFLKLLLHFWTASTLLGNKEDSQSDDWPQDDIKIDRAKVYGKVPSLISDGVEVL